MKIRRKIRFLHRWIGLLASIWILQLALTGLLLQQSKELSLHERYVESVWLLQWFGYGQKTQAFSHQGEQIYQIDDQLIINQQRQRIPQIILFAAKRNNEWLVATEQSLYGLNAQNEIIWRLDDFDGLPTPIENLHVEDRIWIKNNRQWYTIDAEFQIKESHEPVVSLNQAQNKQLTDDERHQIFPKALAQVLSYDKVLADIHAGYKSSVWLNSLSALALLFLSLSGIILFFKTKNKNQKSRH
ncbi:MAG: PepSY domain-containing protein [Proteobacteria bacterium]|nr:PepSY domain-containing protein [Pseudomonadota bacterium]